MNINMDKIVLHSYDYLINYFFERIQNGKLYDENLKPYNKEIFKNSINFFESKEEYEKCAILLSVYKKRFNHEKNFINY
jgi:hypothetical protein